MKFTWQIKQRKYNWLTSVYSCYNLNYLLIKWKFIRYFGNAAIERDLEGEWKRYRERESERKRQIEGDNQTKKQRHSERETKRVRARYKRISELVKPKNPSSLLVWSVRKWFLFNFIEQLINIFRLH